MKWKKFVRDQAERAFVALMSNYPDGLGSFTLDAKDAEYADFRMKMMAAEKDALESAKDSKSKKYIFDLEFGLRMYAYLNEHGFRLWDAADNGNWAFLGIRIIPDIVYRRCGGYNQERFYKRNTRILLRNLWWYICLAEDGDSVKFDIDATRKLLADNSEDLMFLLLDHVGAGFWPTVYHEMMVKYAHRLEKGKLPCSKEDFFRAVMLQHQIKSEVIDPVLCSESEYVDSLFDKVESNLKRIG